MTRTRTAARELAAAFLAIVIAFVTGIDWIGNTPRITPRNGTRAEDIGRAPRDATEKRTYVSLRTVGIIALPMAGCPHGAVLL